MYLALVSNEGSVILLPKKKKVHVFTSYQITVLIKISMGLLDHMKENWSGLNSLPLNSGIPHFVPISAWDLAVLFAFSLPSRVSAGMALPGVEATKKLACISQLSM